MGLCSSNDGAAAPTEDALAEERPRPGGGARPRPSAPQLGDAEYPKEEDEDRKYTIHVPPGAAFKIDKDAITWKGTRIMINHDPEDMKEHEERLTSALERFVCPITDEIPREPVILVGDGQIYERAAIEDWLSYHERSPMTNLPLEPADRKLVRARFTEDLVGRLRKMDEETSKAPKVYQFLAQKATEPVRDKRMVETPMGRPKMTRERYVQLMKERGYTRHLRERVLFDGWEHPALSVCSPQDRWVINTAMPARLKDNPNSFVKVKKVDLHNRYQGWEATAIQRRRAVEALAAMVREEAFPRLKKIYLYGWPRDGTEEILLDTGLVVVFKPERNL